MSRAAGATVGVNGGFFVLDAASGAPGDPAGVGVYNGQLLSEPTAGRPGLVLHADATGTTVRRLTWAGSARIGGRSVALDGINRVPGLIRNCGGDSGDQPTALPLQDITCNDATELVAFTAQYGPKTPSGSGREVVVDAKGLVLAVSRTRGTTLPAGSTSLQGLGAMAEILAQVQVGDRLPVYARLVDTSGETVTTPRDTTIVNGGPLLLKDGLEDITQQRDGMVHPGDPSFAYGWVIKRNPRTFAGIDAQGRTVLVTVDGRSMSDLGLSIPEEADVARSLSPVDAMNLDGGGSTTMALHGRPLSRPGPSTARRAGQARPAGRLPVAAHSGRRRAALTRDHRLLSHQQPTSTSPRSVIAALAAAEGAKV